MANISRPFQIAFLGVVVLAGVWLFALHGGSSSTTSSSAASAPASTPASSSSAASSPSAPAAGGKGSSSPSPVYHGSAPGVEGLSRAIAKAHAAVSTSQKNEKQLETRSAQASESGSHPASTASPTASASAPAAASAPGASATHASTSSPSSSKPAGSSTSNSTQAATTAARQHLVEAQIAKGKVVLILFWNKKGSDDRAAKAAAERFAGGHARTAVVTANANEVAAFGTITRGVQVFGTPTILVVGKSGKAIVLTGLTDSFALTQAISQARHA